MLAVAEFGRNFHGARDAGQVFNPVTGHHAGVVGSTTGDDLHMAHVFQQVGGVGAQGLFQHTAVGDAAFHGGLDHFRLLVDFLEHVVAVFALVGGIGTVLETGNGALYGHAFAIMDLDAAFADVGNIAFFQEHETVGHRQQGQLIGSDEVFTDSHTNYQRAALTADYHVIRLISVDNGQGIGTAQAIQGGFHRLVQAATGPVVFSDQVRHYLGVGLGRELEALGFQFVPQFLVVFDDAVMNDGQAVARHMRMGVELGRLAMGRPAGVGNAHMAGNRVRGDGVCQGSYLAHFPGPLYLVGAADYGHPGGVVTPVFKAAQALQQNTLDVPFRYRSYNPTHAVVTCSLIGLYAFFGRSQPEMFRCLPRATASSPSLMSRVMVEPAPMVAWSATDTGATSEVLEPTNTPSPNTVLCLFTPS